MLSLQVINLYVNQCLDSLRGSVPPSPPVKKALEKSRAFLHLADLSQCGVSASTAEPVGANEFGPTGSPVGILASGKPVLLQPACRSVSCPRSTFSDIFIRNIRIDFRVRLNTIVFNVTWAWGGV